jgi:hypothetical protein
MNISLIINGLNLSLFNDTNLPIRYLYTTTTFAC